MSTFLEFTGYYTLFTVAAIGLTLLGFMAVACREKAR
jgi:hypothetical protein